MSFVKVANVRKHHRTGEETRVYVGRKCNGYEGSPLGNPFRPGGLPGSSIPKFRTWLVDKLHEKDAAVTEEVLRLARIHLSGKSLTLLCWCAPTGAGLTTEDKPYKCHGQEIAEIVQQISEKAVERGMA